MTVVDASGSPIREASVREAPVGSGGGSFMGRALPDAVSRDFKPMFDPRDGERSAFIAKVRCSRGLGYAIRIAAEGYDPLIKSGRINSCADEIEVVLTRNSTPLPAFDALTVLKGRLLDHLGRPITRRFKIVRDGVSYTPKISAAGEYSAKLAPGLYEIRFEPYGCTEHLIKNFRIEQQPRTLNFTVDCL